MHDCFVLGLEIFSLIPSRIANESQGQESGLQINEHATVQPCLPGASPANEICADLTPFPIVVSRPMIRMPMEKATVSAGPEM